MSPCGSVSRFRQGGEGKERPAPTIRCFVFREQVVSATFCPGESQRACSCSHDRTIKARVLLVSPPAAATAPQLPETTRSADSTFAVFGAHG